MKKKKLLLLTGMLVLSLCGCNGQTTTPSTGENTSGEVTTESVAESTQPEESSVEEQTQLPVPENTALKELYASHNMKVGTCLTAQMIDTPALKEIVLGQFSSVTMENAMKPDYIFNKTKSIETGDLVVEFNSDCVKMLNFAKENDLAMRGHTLVWYSQTPEWIFHEDFDTSKPLVNRQIMLSRMESYIKQVFAALEEGGYADQFYAYDVVNEAWMEDGSMRDNNWKTIIGEDYLWQAFYFADKYAPEHIDLYYNDYNEQYKTDTLLAFVDTLKDENGEYLIDGIGLQAHLYTQDDMTSYFNTVDKLAATGLKLQVTELDVSLGAWQKTLKATDENLQTQGRYYYDLIAGLFERADAGTLKMDAITFWGFSDKLSWRKDASPLLYDKNYAPKYAYYGAMQMKDYAGFSK